jgi:hypothetical protein
VKHVFNVCYRQLTISNRLPAGRPPRVRIEIGIDRTDPVALAPFSLTALGYARSEGDGGPLPTCSPPGFAISGVTLAGGETAEIGPDNPSSRHPADRLGVAGLSSTFAPALVTDVPPAAAKARG